MKRNTPYISAESLRGEGVKQIEPDKAPSPAAAAVPADDDDSICLLAAAGTSTAPADVESSPLPEGKGAKADDGEPTPPLESKGAEASSSSDIKGVEDMPDDPKKWLKLRQQAMEKNLLEAQSTEHLRNHFPRMPWACKTCRDTKMANRQHRRRNPALKRQSTASAKSQPVTTSVMARIGS